MQTSANAVPGNGPLTWKELKAHIAQAEQPITLQQIKALQDFVDWANLPALRYALCAMVVAELKETHHTGDSCLLVDGFDNRPVEDVLLLQKFLEQINFVPRFVNDEERHQAMAMFNQPRPE